MNTLDDSDQIDTFLRSLFYYLTKGKAEHDEINIFRKHNNRLDINGDISFPLNYNAWKKYVNQNKETLLPILEYINRKNDDSIFKSLIEISQNWNIPIERCNVKLEKLCIFLNRPIVNKIIITCITSQGKNYGKTNLRLGSHIEIYSEDDREDVSSLDLTQLRIMLLRNVLRNILDKTGNCAANDSSEMIYLTKSSESHVLSKKIVCGVVIAKSGLQQGAINAQKLYEKRATDMQLMAQHKYGVRINSESRWKEFLQDLGKAAVTIDMLFVKSNRPLIINFENPTTPHSKGAAFILYNCARLSAIINQFEKKVSKGDYPPLPSLDGIDFSLLNQPEEWEILYVYLMQYPNVIKSCVKDIAECKINVHLLCSFLDSLCSLFSVYYRRVRILTSPRMHLFPVLHARIYLLKAIQEVYHNTLSLLNIPPVKQM